MTDESKDATAEHSPDRSPNPGKKQEKVEDRDNVSTVRPDDYPDRSKASGKMVE